MISRAQGMHQQFNCTTCNPFDNRYIPTWRILTAELLNLHFLLKRTNRQKAVGKGIYNPVSPISSSSPHLSDTHAAFERRKKNLRYPCETNNSHKTVKIYVIDSPHFGARRSQSPTSALGYISVVKFVVFDENLSRIVPFIHVNENLSV